MFAAPGYAQVPQPQDPSEVELPEEEVSAARQGALTTPSVDQAAKELRSIPGGATLIRAEDFRQGHVNDMSDVLRLSPSVYTQSRFGGSETRLSVRGSGIRQTFNSVGVRILRNGIPLSEADGNFRPQLVDPLIVEYAEVLPGANGLVYGSSTLGGAINFVTPTGHTAKPLQMRAVVGSDDYTHLLISTGRALENGIDYYVVGTMLDRDGFRVHGEERLNQIYGNIGFLLSDEWELRIHGTGTESDLNLPGSLTQAQIAANPRQANPAWLAVDARRDFDMVRGDVQLTGLFDEDQRFDMTFSVQWLEMFHPLPFGLNQQDRFDYTGSLRYRTPLELFGTENELVTGAFFALGDDESQRANVITGVQNRDEQRDAITAEIFAEDRVRITDSLRLIVGAQAALARRELTDSMNPSRNAKDDYSGIQPKLGLLWDPSEDVQVFANVSRSFEPPTTGEIANSTGNLEEQTAWTVEGGVRGGSGDRTWSAAVYYSAVSDELLTVENPVNSGNFETGNADTIHFGVEVGVNQRIPLDLASGKDGDTDAVIARGTYTYNDFEFDGNSGFGSNQLPGIPPHVFRAEVLYDHPSGFYGGLNVDVSSSWYVDFANTRNGDSFAILGATAGFESENRWKAFLDLVNLEDKNYASNSGIATNVNGMDTALFNSGMPFSLFLGLEITL